MTEQTLDARLQAVLLDSLRQEFGTMDDAAEADFSPRFRKEMAKMVADPRGWYKRKSRPVWKQTLHTAASVALVLILSFAVVIAAVPSARAAFLGWLKEKQSSYMRYTFEEKMEATDLSFAYRVSMLPEGYAEYIIDDSDQWGYVAYVDDITGHLLSLGYLRNPSQNDYFLGIENAEAKTATVNGCPADLYVSLVPNEGSCIIWTDKKNTLITLNGFLDEETLIAIAESVVMVEVDPDESATE